MITQGKKAFVGLSGGVDSAVSAALLKQAGYEVTGVFIKVWQPDWMDCNWREDRLDAMRVAAHLDIPFATLDLEKEYKRDVVDYMVAEYRAGRTPNPDVMCNKSVKFGGFYDWAMSHGADFVATGHYAQVVENENKNANAPRRAEVFFVSAGGRNEKALVRDGEGRTEGNEEFSLLAGLDKNKDQSYFLWNILIEQLPHILFPIGRLAKPEVRKLAAKFKLPNADKKDSQGLCFIGKVDFREFLSHYIEPKKGIVLDDKGNAVGTHDGAAFLTIGERHGFTIDRKTPHDEPLFIIGKDVQKNTVTVSPKGPDGLLAEAKRTVKLEKTNWIGAMPEIGKKYYGRARYRQPLEELAFTSIKGDSAEIEFSMPQNALTPGQSLVVYDGEVCLGGGFIL